MGNVTKCLIYLKMSCSFPTKRNSALHAHYDECTYLDISNRQAKATMRLLCQQHFFKEVKNKDGACI